MQSNRLFVVSLALVLVVILATLAFGQEVKVGFY